MCALKASDFSPWEKETSINFNMGDKFAHMYTRMKTVMTYMKTNGYTPDRVDKDDRGNIVAMVFTVPTGNIRLPKKVVQRKLTVEHKEKLTKAANKARKSIKKCI